MILCPHCSAELSTVKTFCSCCGCHGSHIIWKWEESGEGKTSLTMTAENAGFASTSVRVKFLNASGILPGKLDPRTLNPSSTVRFVIERKPGESLSGDLIGESQDAPRPEKKWWERKNWRQEKFRLDGLGELSQERWVIGAETLLFPPGVAFQFLSVWNAASRDRDLTLEAPSRFRLSQMGADMDRKSRTIGRGNRVEFRLEPLKGETSPPSFLWSVLPELDPVSVIRLKAKPISAGVAAVVAIDFGTRNTSVRIRWRQEVVEGKPAGTVDVLGDERRFPTLMAVHQRFDEPYFGTEAEGKLRNEEGFDAIEGLKTAMRNGDEPYLSRNPLWTVEWLVERYFHFLFDKLDQYLETLSLRREDLEIDFVVTRPVLDKATGDHLGSSYEMLIELAALRCDIPEKRLYFMLEPEAAANCLAHTHRAQLLKIQGETIAVVDAGGGTTDILLAKVKGEGGNISLDVLASYSLRPEEDPASVMRCALAHFALSQKATNAARVENEMGGDTLDRALAHRLTYQASDVLETRGRPVPLLLSPEITNALDYLQEMRNVKENFVQKSEQYLCFPRDYSPEPDEAAPFPEAKELEGVYVSHPLYDDFILKEVLRAPFDALKTQMTQEARLRNEPLEVKHLFCVGGTNLDRAVRHHFRTLFPGLREELPLSEQERVCAVAEGAVLRGETLFLSSPLTLSLRYRPSAMEEAQTKILLQEGASVLSDEVRRLSYNIRFDLTDYRELEAELIAEGGGLDFPVIVGKAYAVAHSVENEARSLTVDISVKEGIVIKLSQPNGTPLDLIKFRLFEKK